MNNAPLKPFFVLIIVMFITSLALACTVNVRITDEAGVQTVLPDRVGPWTGKELFFCQNAECRAFFTIDKIAANRLCSACGSELDTMDLDERAILPRDTVIRKKIYTHPAGKQLMAALVLTGKERVSIHRPELCLSASYSIEGAQNLMIPLDERDPLRVKVLDLLHKQDTRNAHFYAYWFVGKDRETASHYRRTWWMAYDRIFRNMAHRWAYLSVSGQRPVDSNQYHEELKTFVSRLYPQMIKTGALAR